MTAKRVHLFCMLTRAYCFTSLHVRNVLSDQEVTALENDQPEVTQSDAVVPEVTQSDAPSLPVIVPGNPEASQYAPPAFRYVIIHSKQGSTFKISCSQCFNNKIRSTSGTQWTYGHILRKPGFGVVPCTMTPALYEEKDPEWFAGLTKSYDNLLAKQARLAAGSLPPSVSGTGSGVDSMDLSSASPASSAPNSKRARGPNSVSTDSVQPVSGGTLHWHLKSPVQKAEQRAKTQRAWDLAFNINGIAFKVADEDTFNAAIAETRLCPDFKLHCRQFMATTGLDAVNDMANAGKAERLKEGIRLGFVHITDGWKSGNKKGYHNHLLLSVLGPIYLCLNDVTGKSGKADDVADEITTVQGTLEKAISDAISMGLTDTPSANRKAWRILEAKHPSQTWLNCMLHEVSLFFGECTRKVARLKHLAADWLRIVRWMNNHSELLKLFRVAVKSEVENNPTGAFNGRHLQIGFYAPGDTRMATVFKMASRLFFLRPVLVALAANPEFVGASQKALKAWSDGQKDPTKKLQLVDGVYPDRVVTLLRDPLTFGAMHAYVTTFKAPMYLLRLMDSGGPCIGKVYYACCLVDKYLRVACSMNSVSYAQEVYDIFMKRWRRWHRPIHTLAYSLDPSYHGHVLNAEELADVTIALKKLHPTDYPSVKVELSGWRATKAHTPDAEWNEVEQCHAWQWHDNFNLKFPKTRALAMKVLSKGCSASATEWCWSDVGHVLSKKRQKTHTATLDKQVNVRAMARLNKSILSSGLLLTPLPTLDVYLDELIDEVQNEAALMGILDAEDDVVAVEVDEVESDDEDGSDYSASSL